MTSTFNRIALTGRLGQDVETRYFESGRILAKGSLAVDNPASKEHPFWFPLEMWGKTAEIAADYTGSGSLIGVEGELTIEFWLEDNGQQRCKPVVRVNRLHLMERNPNQQASQSAAPVSYDGTLAPITY